MDPILAELYGTDELVKEAAQQDTQEEEVDLEEYLAKEAADAFVEWANEEGIDLSKEAEEDIESSYAEFADGFIKAAAEEMSKEAGYEDEELQEKLAEADTLGRLMAHAYVNELAGIEKEAGSGSALKRFGSKAKSFAQALGGHKGAKKAIEEAYEKTKTEASDAAAKKYMPKGRRAWTKGMSPREKGLATQARFKTESNLAKTQGEDVRKELADIQDEVAKARLKLLAGAGVGTAATGIPAAALAGSKTKSASYEEVYDEAVQERAYELLKEAGYLEDQELDISEEEKIAYAIEHDALVTLEELGLPVEWADNE